MPQFERSLAMPIHGHRETENRMDEEAFDRVRMKVTKKCVISLPRAIYLAYLHEDFQSREDSL